MRGLARQAGLATLAAAVLLCAGCPDRDGRARSGQDISRDTETAPEPTETGGAASAGPTKAAAVDPGTARALEALGYVPTTPTDNPEERGVTTQEDEASTRGLNLYSSRRRASAVLTDMDGQIVHRWQAPDADDPHRRWMHVEPLPSGALLAITKDRDLAKHGWDSEVIWRTRLRAHHDLAVRDDGRVLALVRDRDEIEHGGRTLPILIDSIAVLSVDGEVQRTVPLLPLVRPLVDEHRLRRLAALLDEDGSAARLTKPGSVGDLLHTNSISVLDHDIPEVAPAGSLLLSFRNASRIAILDADMTRVLWSWGAGELDAQHDATQLPNGHILLFDNGLHRGNSRVLEVDPTAGAIVWSYAPDGLYSRLRGGAQLLPNGHVLITESDRGHALEVTRDGEMVWEFWNPDVRGQGEDAERGIIYRLNRFPRSFFQPLQS